MELFGTDGIRGRVNVEPMTVDTAVKVARAAAVVFRRHTQKKTQVLIGKDTRLSGYMFEEALAAGLCSMGVDVWLVGPLPTPAIAFLTSSMRADAGIVISASHNPFDDNGIKFFGPDGFKLPDSVEEHIESLTASPDILDTHRPESSLVGRTRRLEDARGRYISFLKGQFPRSLTLDGVKIVIDAAHGAAYRIAPVIFEELGATVVSIGVSPNGKNINEGAGALFPDELRRHVLLNEADVGLAVDGDADRIVMVDRRGRVIDGDDILSILAPAMLRDGVLGAGVVGTVMSNFGLETYMKSLGISFERANVGDRYVVEKMREMGAMLGGEPSGHIVCLDRASTGDGLLCGLLVLAELVRQQKPLDEIKPQFERLPQVIKNVKVARKPPLETLPRFSALISQCEKKLKGEGRVLVRYSGTESKLRVMVEGKDEVMVRALVDELVTVVQSEIGVLV